jgi:hypothetical protein
MRENQDSNTLVPIFGGEVVIAMRSFPTENFSIMSSLASVTRNSKCDSIGQEFPDPNSRLSQSSPVISFSSPDLWLCGFPWHGKSFTAKKRKAASLSLSLALPRLKLELKSCFFLPFPLSYPFCVYDNFLMSDNMQAQKPRRCQGSKFAEGRLKLSTACTECHKRKQKVCFAVGSFGAWTD